MTAQSTYNRRSEARSIAAGKRRMPGGLMDRAEVRALDWLIRRYPGKSKRALIGEALAEKYERERKPPCQK